MCPPALFAIPSFTLLLAGPSEPTTRAPTYGRHGSVRGSLILEQDANNICEIVAKLEGRLEVTTTDSGVLITKVVKNIVSLWSSSASSSSCPRTIGFVCDFPATFQHQGCDYPLPPSYTARFPGYPSLFAKCTYTLTISINKDRRLGFLPKTKLIYEWHQSSFVMNTRSSSTLLPIQCQAFIPSVKVFGLCDSIPLHVQLSGSLSSLRQLILPSCLDPDEGDLGHLPLRVYLTRMVSFEYRGKATWRVKRIGEGQFRPLPPVVDFDCDCELTTGQCDSCDTSVDTLHWDGELKCDSTVTVGGFQAAGLIVKDFITLEIIPPKAVLSPLLTIQHAIPIRLVTETFVAPT
ncbi:hypothetical protein B0H19DRAFT_1206806 [Mycena capillaripes]|nr:hypothetical protein B0H19DRAFT_1206806 [Mycena capillaripes]